MNKHMPQEHVHTNNPGTAHGNEQFCSFWCICIMMISINVLFFPRQIKGMNNSHMHVQSLNSQKLFILSTPNLLTAKVF